MIRLLHDGASTGATNMAIDEMLMESARDGEVTVRFYTWSPGTLSFGRNQAAVGRYDAAEAARRGIGLVRRPTGGRAVYHDRELTYSVTAPADAWGSLSDAYCRINHALAAGLHSLGAPVGCASGGASAPRPTARACFRDPLPGEVTALGRKLVGSAQWRDSGALLQHGSLLLANDQAVSEELLADPASRGGADAGAVGLDEVLPDPPSLPDLVQALARGFEVEFGEAVEPGPLTDDERQRAGALRPRYEDPVWTWRR